MSVDGLHGSAKLYCSVRMVREPCREIFTRQEGKIGQRTIGRSPRATNGKLLASTARRISTRKEQREQRS